MVEPASINRWMVPRPESNNTLVAPMLTSTAQLLRLRDGTQVPDPKIVTVQFVLWGFCVTVALDVFYHTLAFKAGFESREVPLLCV